MTDPFRPLVRNFWSIFFVVAAVTVPLHVAHAAIWHDVIAVSELHADIEEFPPLRQVHGVGRTQLDQFRIAYLIVLAIELVLVPLFHRATRRILEVDEEGGVPSAVDGWRAALTGGTTGLGLLASVGRHPVTTFVAALAAYLVYWFVFGIGGFLVYPWGDEWMFAGRGLVDGVARAAGAPFFLVVTAFAAISPLPPRLGGPPAE